MCTKRNSTKDQSAATISRSLTSLNPHGVTISSRLVPHFLRLLHHPAIYFSLVVLLAGGGTSYLVATYRHHQTQSLPAPSVPFAPPAPAVPFSPTTGHPPMTIPALPNNPVPSPTPPLLAPAYVDLFVDALSDRVLLAQHYTGAKFEPVYGCYVGAYLQGAYHLDGDEQADTGLVNREEAFARHAGKPLATTFRYVGYGRPFPIEWAKASCERGVAPHIAFEPNDGLDMVRDDAYLQQFAKDAAACGGPIFLRFASEMNGDWTNYHKNPAQYREKFKLVHDVMARHAPNVAMMWCVFTSPMSNIPKYYPGDAYVDWVGVNIYNVYYHNNNKSLPGWHEHPAELLDYVYQTFSKRKPIAIAEYGASHIDTTEGKSRPDFAASKLTQLLTALPRHYPRVKMINFFECNNIKYALPGRKVNNYAIIDSPKVLAALKRVIAADYFLSTVVTDGQETLPTPISRLTNGYILRGTVHLSAWVKTNEFSPIVVYALDGKSLGHCQVHGQYDTYLDTAKYPNGTHTLTVAIRNRAGKTLGKTSTRVTFQN